MKLIYVGRHQFEYKGVTLPANVVVEVDDEVGNVLKGKRDVHEVKGEEKSLLKNFRDHMILEDGEEKYQCPTCGKKFDTKKALTGHRNGANH